MTPSATPVIPPMPRIGDKAPDFKAVTTHGEIQFSEWAKDSWVVLFSHPADFTPVCSTELSLFAKMSSDFGKRGVKLIGLSEDSVHSHLAWTEDLKKMLGVAIGYPLIADHNGEVAHKYGMIHPSISNTATVRAVFIIDPTFTVRALVYYPMNVGRNMDEILRVVDALQTADTNKVACPANWKPGEKVILPAPKTEKDLQARLGQPGIELKSWYLATKQL